MRTPHVRTSKVEIEHDSRVGKGGDRELLGTAIGNSAILAVAWSVVISAVCFFWSTALYNRPRAV
jgi:hypothetical protein